MEYDAAGQSIALHTASQTLAFGYDRAGREVTRQLGAVTLAQTWDVNHRLRTQALTALGNASAPGSVRPQRLVQRRAYTYRADGVVTNIVDQLAGARHFDLDQLGRVTQVEGPGYRENYAYDPTGNITHAVWPTPQTELAAVGPRVHTGTLIRSAGNTRYEHDRQGRVTARHSRTLSGQTRTWRYVWSSDDWLIAVTTPDGVTWRYTYDPLGRRTAKLRLGPNGEVTERIDFTWDGTVLAEQTHISGHTTTWDYQPGTFTPLTQTERAPVRHAPQEWIDQQFYAIVTDLVGTPTELVDPAGSLAWRQTMTLWGAPLVAPRQRAYCPLRFPGQYLDPETGQNYNYFRYYNPADGGYTAADPLGLEGGPNPHAYVPNPSVWLDPLGLTPCRIKQLKIDLGRAGMSVRKYDIVHVPEILDHNGEPIYGRSRADGAGNPVRGPRGRPLIEITNLGLSSRNEAVATIFHEMYHIKSFKQYGHGGTEAAAEEYGQRMLDRFLRRTRRQ